MITMNEVLYLYSKILPVRVKNEDRQERRAYISVAVELHTVISPLPKKELLIRLTEDKDLFFLYTLTLTEDDFQSLKSQQGLLVDFSAFLQKFVDLLELCLQEEAKDLPKFLLVLSTSHSMLSCPTQAVLDVVETNPFKHLTHLSLRFVQGSDADVKKYLATCLKSLKDSKERVESLLQSTEGSLRKQLAQAQESLACKSAELERVKCDWKDHAAALNARLAQDVSVEREKALQIQSELQVKYERELRDMEYKHTKEVQQLENRASGSEGQVKELTDKRYHLESSNREFKSRLSSTDEELKYIKQEQKVLRQENSSLDAQIHERDKLINSLKMRVAVLEQEVKDKNEILARQQTLLDTTQEQKKRAEEALEQRQAQVVKRETSLKQLAEELNKANDIIRKLQGEIKNIHTKLKMRTQIALEQEKVISDKDQQLVQLKEEASSLKDTIKQKGSENQKLQDELESTSLKLDDIQRQQKTNENVINWLNKQLNEKQLRVPSVPMANSPPFPGLQATRTAGTLFYGAVNNQKRLGPPVASSTPQYFGYNMPAVGNYNHGPHLSSVPDTAKSKVNQTDKENSPPLDPKYYQPSPLDNGGAIARKSSTDRSPGSGNSDTRSPENVRNVPPQVIAPSTSKANSKKTKAPLEKPPPTNSTRLPKAGIVSTSSKPIFATKTVGQIASSNMQPSVPLVSAYFSRQVPS